MVDSFGCLSFSELLFVLRDVDPVICTQVLQISPSVCKFAVLDHDGMYFSTANCVAQCSICMAGRGANGPILSN